MTAPALIVGFARAIAIVLEDGQIIDSLVHSIAGVLEGMPPDVSALGMLVVQSLCNFFIPSGTGQAFVTMPIMSPLATLTGVPQQTAVLAFQFGDGFSNMIIPTNALVMGALALGKVPYTAWVRFVGPLMVKILLLAAVCLVFSVHFGDVVGLY
ncbi:MAG: TIGR00366 family protein [Woeseiaceae bacterium]